MYVQTVSVNSFSYVFTCVGDGCLVAWGWNEHGMCGTGDTTNQMSPTLINLGSKDGCASSKVLNIGCGSGHSVALVSSSSIE